MGYYPTAYKTVAIVHYAKLAYENKLPAYFRLLLSTTISTHTPLTSMVERGLPILRLYKFGVHVRNRTSISPPINKASADASGMDKLNLLGGT